MTETLLDVDVMADEITGEEADTNKSPVNDTTDRFLSDPTHKLAAEIISHHYQDKLVYERFSAREGRFWLMKNGGYFEPFDDILNQASKVLDDAVDKAFLRKKDKMKGKAEEQLYTQAGTAHKKAQTRDFVQNALVFLAGMVLVPNLSSKWNATPECMPTQTGVLDYSGEEIILRKPKPDEYFRNPLPIDGQKILESDGIAPPFELFLLDVFPDSEVRHTAMECLSLAMGNRGSRVFQLWHGAGANGKNLTLDILRTILPNRVGTAPSAMITRSDQSTKRFAASNLDGLTFAAVDECTGAFDVAEVKRLTGNSTISVEKKGVDVYNVPQRWTLAALTNNLPAFWPATDAAFLERLILLPFETTFYFDDRQREDYMRLGIPKDRLKEAKDSSELLAKIAEYTPAILKKLILTYQTVKKNGGRPYECQKCRQLKQRYQSDNDTVQQFFLEYLEREKTGRIEYSRIVALWKEYTGDKQAATREVIRRLIDRFPWVQKQKSNGTGYLLGIREKENSDPNDLQKVQEDNSASFIECSSAEVPGKISAMGKLKIPIADLKESTFGTLALSKPEVSPDQPFSLDAGKVLETLRTMEDEYQMRLESAGVGNPTPLVEVEDLRERAADAGIAGQRFTDAIRALGERHAVECNTPYIVITGEPGKEVKQ